MPLAHCVTPVACAVALMFSLLLPVSSIAQGARPAQYKAGAASVLKVRQSRIVGRQTMIATPEFRTSVPKTGGRPQEWSKIEVEYDTAPEWIDVLTVKFHVMTVAKVDKKPAFSIFRETIDFVDIAQGREHLAAAFLRPKTVKRYGEPAVVHIEFSIAGDVVGVVDEFDPSMRNKVPADWYKNDNVLKQDYVTVRDGYLLNRSKTPFALVNIDAYEDIR